MNPWGKAKSVVPTEKVSADANRTRKTRLGASAELLQKSFYCVECLGQYANSHPLPGP